MELPENGFELLRWVTSTGQDSRGTYHIITGYEGTGECFWCGGELTGRKIRYCGIRGHWTRYAEYFYWPYAADWCRKRYDHTCANCGATEKPFVVGWDIRTSIEVHHIVPLEGSERTWSIFNLPWNLICLCHTCHLEIHDTMKIKHLAPTNFDQAIKRGQLVLEGII